MKDTWSNGWESTAKNLQGWDNFLARGKVAAHSLFSGCRRQHLVYAQSEQAGVGSSFRCQ